MKRLVWILALFPLLAGCDPALYLNLGTGLAAAIVANGAVVSGAHGAAGEIGYNLRSVQDVAVADDDRVILEDAVSGRGLADPRSGRWPNQHKTECGINLVDSLDSAKL